MNMHFELFDESKRNSFISKRYDLDQIDSLEPEDAATSFAQQIELCENLEDLNAVNANYIVIGIPEDIGVRANLGREGASEAWDSFLNSFLGLQHTSLNNASRFCVLGHVFTKDLMNQATDLNLSLHKDRLQLSELVKMLDQRVSEIATKVVEAGKTPVVIGGGHNNSYPLLRACGYSESVDCINIDAHTDLRAAKGRHSGNGFSHAIQEGYLNSYFMMGIQENYLSEPMIQFIESNLDINYSTYRTEKLEVEKEVLVAFQYINSSRFALEIDLDVVAGFPSSAQSPVGYSLSELRSLINEIIVKAAVSPAYIHICEAAPKYGYHNQAGKALATLVNDLP